MGSEVVLSKPMANARMLAPWVALEHEVAKEQLRIHKVELCG